LEIDLRDVRFLSDPLDHVLDRPRVRVLVPPLAGERAEGARKLANVGVVDIQAADETDSVLVEPPIDLIGDMVDLGEDGSILLHEEKGFNRSDLLPFQHRPQNDVRVHLLPLQS
jgi:hypothetical protein